MRLRLRWHRRCAIVLLLVGAQSGGWERIAAAPNNVVGFFVDDQMQLSAGECELIVLKSYHQQFAALFQGGTGASCEVEKRKVFDCLVRCGEHRRFTSTTYNVNKGITAVLVVYTTPSLLSVETEVSLGKFDADYEKRALYEEGRHDLREYWLSLSSESRRQVKRAYALLVAPTGGNAQQVQTWFE